MNLTDAELDALRPVATTPTVLEALRALDARRSIIERTGEEAMGDLQPMIDHVERTGVLVVRRTDGVSYGNDFRGRSFTALHVPCKKDGTPMARRRSRVVKVPTILVAGVAMTVQTWDEVRPMFQRALDALAIPFDDANGVHGITSTVRCAVEPVHVVMKTFVVRGDFGHEATCQEGEEYRFFNIHKPLSPGTIAWSSCYGNHQIGPMTWSSSATAGTSSPPVRTSSSSTTTTGRPTALASAGPERIPAPPRRCSAPCNPRRSVP